MTKGISAQVNGSWLEVNLKVSRHQSANSDKIDLYYRATAKIFWTPSNYFFTYTVKLFDLYLFDSIVFERALKSLHKFIYDSTYLSQQNKHLHVRMIIKT